jgi:hypothetical protein
VFKSGRRHEANPVRVPEVEAIAIQVRAQFEVQEQCAIKRMPKSHMESALDVLYMVGSTIS